MDSISMYQDYVHEGLVKREQLGKPTDDAHLLLEMVGELGEVLNAHKHARVWPEPAPTEEEHLGEELGDLLWYVVAVCDTLGFDVEKVVSNNIAKLDARYGRH